MAIEKKETEKAPRESAPPPVGAFAAAAPPLTAKEAAKTYGEIKKDLSAPEPPWLLPELTAKLKEIHPAPAECTPKPPPPVIG